MSYQQVRDILHDVREFHRRFRDGLAQVEEESNPEHVEEIAKDFRHHEQVWQAALAQYGEQGEAAVLNTWIQYVPTDAIPELLAQFEASSKISLDELVERAVRFRGALIELYETLAEEVQAPRVQRFFNTLVAMEKSVAAEHVWSTRET